MRRVLLVLTAAGLVASTFGGAIARAATPAPPKWSVTPSPSPPGPTTTSLQGVACPTIANCFVVGSGEHAPVVGHSTGTSWTIGEGAAVGDGLAFPNLRAIACPSTTKCFAAGRKSDPYDGPLIERWDGSAWSIVPTPAPSDAKGSELMGIACTTISSCFAVGSATYTLNIDEDVTKTLVEQWDGSSWSIVASPSVDGVFVSKLAAVSCATATSCYAVGSGRGTLVERWDGTAWSIIDSNPAGSNATSSSLSSVSCAGPACVAVGSTVVDASDPEDVKTVPFIESLQGGNASIATAPVPGSSRSSALGAVSCPTTTSCYAAGAFSSTPGSTQSLVEHFNGTSWSIDASGTGSQTMRPDAIACPTATDCVAVGFGYIGRRSGARWTIEPKGSQSELHDVSCDRVTSCFAVGDASSDGVARRPLIEHWNGRAWSLVASPRPVDGPYDDRLLKVSCPTSTTCIAVGSYTTSRFKPLVERWNGSRWSVITGTEPAGAIESFLTDVSCSSAASCLAVGYYYVDAPDGNVRSYMLVERWDGAKWSIVPGAKRPTIDLSGLHCFSSTNCIAVGAVIAHWDGTSFSVVPSPHLSDANHLASVSCATVTSCFAVGVRGQYVEASIIQGETLVERWDGKRWSVVASPDAGSETFDSALSDVSCATPTSCVASGFSLTGNNNFPVSKRLVEQWNGKRWSVAAAAPDPPNATASELSGVACVAASSCLGVGSYDTPGSRWTRAERFG